MGARYLDNLDQIEVFSLHLQGIATDRSEGSDQTLGDVRIFTVLWSSTHSLRAEIYPAFSLIQRITELKYFHGLAKKVSADAINNK